MYDDSPWMCDSSLNSWHFFLWDMVMSITGESMLTIVYEIYSRTVSRFVWQYESLHHILHNRLLILNTIWVSFVNRILAYTAVKLISSNNRSSLESCQPIHCSWLFFPNSLHKASDSLFCNIEIISCGIL